MGVWKTIGSWRISKWIYKNGRDLFQWAHITRHSGRQHFHIGWLARRLTKTELRRHLKKAGFEHDPYAWVDKDEVLSMRMLVKEKYQYHIRLHKDGEIKGHYEYAPDSKPLKHLDARYFRRKKRYFRKLLEGVLDKKGRSKATE